MSASISRIYVPSGIEFDINNFDVADTGPTFADENKKYIRSLRSNIETINNKYKRQIL